MAKKTNAAKDDKPAPPTPGLAFIVGLFLFSIIICPASVFAIFNFQIYSKIQMALFHAIILGCFMSIAIATIPAFIFMYYTMKRVRNA